MFQSLPFSAARKRPAFIAFVVVLAVLGALLSALGQASSARADGGSATLSGTITDSATAAPIADVSVQLSSQDGAYSDFATTADDGTYSFSTIPAGSYTLYFQPAQGSNYLQQWWKNNSTGEAVTYFPITDGQALTAFDAALQPGASIGGTVDVAEAPGAGLANVNITVQSTDGLYSGNAQTDGDGHYSVVGLPGDAYYVDFQPNDGVHVAEWWNDQPSLETANFVVVGAAGAASGIDARLAVGATIRGRVYVAGSPNTPLAGATVIAFGSQNDAVQSATTDPDGNYTIMGLPDGSYVVDFAGPSGTNLGTQYWNNTNAAVTATPIAVTGSASATNIDAVLTAGATIRGTVFAPGAPNIGLKGVEVSVFSANGGQPLGSSTTNASGHYDVQNLAPGSYSIQFAPQRRSHAAVEWWGGTFIQTGAKSVAVTAGQTVTGISQQLITGSTISGTVLDAGSPATPDTNVTVLLWASDQSIGSLNFPPLQTRTNASGRYSFTHMGPGSYTVEFAPEGPGFLSQWWKDKPSQARATPVVVKGGVAASGINATLAPAVITPGTPTIAGRARVGATLTAKTGSWRPKSIIFTYQWLRDGVAIPGEVRSIYVPTTGDVGATLAVAVTGEIPAFESQGTMLTVTSAATARVAS